MKIPVFLPVTREFGLRDEFAKTVSSSSESTANPTSSGADDPECFGLQGHGAARPPASAVSDAGDPGKPWARETSAPPAVRPCPREAPGAKSGERAADLMGGEDLGRYTGVSRPASRRRLASGGAMRPGRPAFLRTKFLVPRALSRQWNRRKSNGERQCRRRASPSKASIDRPQRLRARCQRG